MRRLFLLRRLPWSAVSDRATALGFPLPPFAPASRSAPSCLALAAMWPAKSSPPAAIATACHNHNQNNDGERLAAIRGNMPVLLRQQGAWGRKSNTSSTTRSDTVSNFTTV